MKNNVFRVLVTFCQPLDIPAEGGRSSIQGTQVKYLMAGEDLSMLQTERGFNAPLGYQNLKCFLEPEAIQQLTAAPAFYDCEFRMVAGSDGKLVSKPVSFEYVADACFLMLNKEGQLISGEGEILEKAALRPDPEAAAEVPGEESASEKEQAGKPGQDLQGANASPSKPDGKHPSGKSTK